MNPFNPQLPARPDFFVGREPEIKEFYNFLCQTIQSSPMNMAITGNRGMGKTSLLLKFEQMAKENNCLTIRLSNYEGNVNSIVELTEFISSNLKREVISKNFVEGVEQWLKTFKPTIEWNDLAFSIEKQQIVQELLTERLLRIWDKVKYKYKAIVIFIDEAESLEKVEGSLPFLREVFQKLSLDANYMLVIAGKLNFPERMSESFSPLNRFFPVHKLERFNEEETSKYLNRKLNSVNVKVDEEVISKLTLLSEGHPYVLVAMSYLIFDSLEDIDNKINIKIVDRCMDKIKGKLAQDFFAPMYHPLSRKAKKIICEISNNVNDLDFTFKDAINWTKMEGNYLSPYMLELTRKGIINRPERANYQIFHSLFKTYLKENCIQKI
jgi:Cdc6-like AAA superfamily ATPase